MNTTKHNLNFGAPPPSPNRLMSGFLAQKTRLLTALNDEGGLFECRFLGRLLERSTAGITTAHTGAVEIHTGLAELRQQLLLDLSLDDDTPGALDPQEQSRLLKLMARLGLTTRHHEGQIKELL